MNIKLNTFFTLFILSITTCFYACSDNNHEIKEIDHTENIIKKFALVDPTDDAKRLECSIDTINHEIIANVIKGLDISNFLVDYQLTPDAEGLTPSHHTIPSDNRFLIRSEARNADYIYNIKITEQEPFEYFTIYNDADTIKLNVNPSDRTITGYFPSANEASDFKVNYGTTEGIFSDVENNTTLTGLEQKFSVNKGGKLSVEYTLNFTPIEPQDLDPYLGFIYSATSGFSFDCRRLLLNENTQTATAFVSIGGNSFDLDGFEDFTTIANNMQLLFNTNARIDVLKNRTKIVNIDAENKIIDFSVEYGFRYTKRTWTYRIAFDDKIDYTSPKYTANSGYNFSPEYAWLIIDGKKYLGELPRKANSTRTDHVITFYQAKEDFYDIANQPILTPNAIDGAFRTCIPNNVNLKNATLELSFADSFRNISVNEKSFNALPSFDSEEYRGDGVSIKFDNTDHPGDSRLDWKIKIKTLD